MHGKTAPSCGLHSQGGVRRGVRASGSYQEGTGKSGSYGMWNHELALVQELEALAVGLHHPVLDPVLRPADHHAVALLEAPDPTGDADVHEAEALGRGLLGAAHRVAEVRVR